MSRSRFSTLDVLKNKSHPLWKILRNQDTTLSLSQADLEITNITEITPDLGDAYGNITIINNEGDIIGGMGDVISDSTSSSIGNVPTFSSEDGKHIIDSLSAGAGTDAGGGSATLAAGAGDGTGSGGDISILSGNGGATGNGGDLVLSGGVGGATSGNGGKVNISGGNTLDGNGGDITLSPGTVAGTGTNGIVQINSDVNLAAGFEYMIDGTPISGGGLTHPQIMARISIGF